MSNYEYDEDYISQQELKDMEKRASCLCTFLKCPNCGRSQDNLFDEQKHKIHILKKIIRMYERALSSYGIIVLPIDLLEDMHIIDGIIERRKLHYEDVKKNVRIGTRA